MVEQVKDVNLTDYLLLSCTKEHCSLLFADLSEEAFTELMELMLFIDYKKGELIFQEGSLASGIYIICSGQMKYGKYSANKRKKRLLKIFEHKEILELETVCQKGSPTYIGYAKALTDTRVAFIEREAFNTFLKAHPRALFKLCEEVTRELRVFECRLVEHAYGTIEENMARLFLILGDRYGVVDELGLRIDIELSRSDLASLLGISIETAIRFLSQLKDNGLISLRDREIIITDRQGLESLVSLPTTCVEECLV